MWCIYTTEYYSPMKKKETAICSNMVGPRDDHTQWSKPDRKTNTILYHLHVDSLKKKKKKKKELVHRTETDSDLENKVMVTKGERW